MTDSFHEQGTSPERQQQRVTSWAGLLASGQQQHPLKPSIKPSCRRGSLASEKRSETVDVVGQVEKEQTEPIVVPGSAPPYVSHAVSQSPPLVPKEQICFDFTKGQCRRGASCKFSHDLAHIIHVNSQEKGICFDFLKGTCTRGVMCRFSHDLSNLKAQGASEGGTAGSSSGRQQGNAFKKSSNVHICYDFVRNKCTKGDACRYSHDYSTLLNKMSMVNSSSGSGAATPSQGGSRRASLSGVPGGAQEMSMMQTQVIGAMARTPERHPVGTNQHTCIDFLRGSCPRGPFCEMSHYLPALSPPSTPSSHRGHQTHVPGGHYRGHQPESLESLINRLKKLQYEEAMMVNNTMMPGSNQRGAMFDTMGNHHAENYPHSNTFSYPPPTSMHSDGARMMTAYWSGRQAHACENENDNQNNAIFSPMSPPVTHAEKSKMSARIRMLQQQGIRGHQLTPVAGMDLNGTNKQGECASPMIGAGWDLSQSMSDDDMTATGGASSLESKAEARLSAAADLMSMLTLRTIWPDEHT